MNAAGSFQQHARVRGERFPIHFRKAHRHSCIGLMTPAQLHYGLAPQIHADRSRVLLNAYETYVSFSLTHSEARYPPVPES
ncbi:hypothetical protein CSA56_18555 [candidate division KSB3 bacterium]|uniref:Uncharacterized protein n=1 Tax=candidate division KSB3 bacterium TaxID=2044937 RepID=A0A2G6K6K7_9BACT|nr:MAG: hypothetical protein CSA56_18555 [candidate division KSB3 bacterium]